MAHLHDTGYKLLFSHADLVRELLEVFAPPGVAELLDYKLNRKLPDLPELDVDEVLKGTEMLATNLDRIRANAIAEGVLIGEIKGELKGKLEGDPRCLNA